VKISTRTEYGVRILAQIARHPGEGPISLAGIARAEKMPHAYLEQLVRDLRRAGLVRATRGQAGGYELTRPAAEISLADAVRALEGALLEMPCGSADNLEACDRLQPCSVHDAFQRVYESLTGSLGATNLAEVAAATGGPPYPPRARKRLAAAHAAAQESARAAEAVRTVPPA